MWSSHDSPPCAHAVSEQGGRLNVGGTRQALLPAAHTFAACHHSWHRQPEVQWSSDIQPLTTCWDGRVLKTLQGIMKRVLNFWKCAPEVSVLPGSVLQQYMYKFGRKIDEKDERDTC